MIYYSGYVWQEDEKDRVKEIKKALKKVKAEDILVCDYDYGYNHVKFSGKLKEDSKVSEWELLTWAGDLQFGGECEINGTEFKGRYYTD